jgi:hypothetical protein
MRHHDEHSRVPTPEDDAIRDKIEYGRQLAMDRIVLDECRSMMAPTGDTNRNRSHSRPHARGKVLWIVSGLAASILGVWGIAWSTGAWGSGTDSATDSTGGESTELVRREAASDLQVTAEKRGDAVAAVPGAPEEPSPKQDTPRRVAQSKDNPQPKKTSGKTATTVPDAGVKLKKLAIPKRNADGEIPIPASADPEDIKLIRSAVAMFEAEEKLARMVKAGKIKGVDRMLTFDEVASWPYEDGLKGMPGAVKKLDGQKVLMTGFMLPIDAVENIREFLLVESLWSCCYGQPPDINGTVRVVLKGESRTDYMFEPIKMIGTFRVEPTIEDGFCVDVFQLEVERVEVIE